LGADAVPSAVPVALRRKNKKKEDCFRNHGERDYRDVIKTT
jgi:hypothetical protein